jgi:hypothetical protein
MCDSVVSISRPYGFPFFLRFGQFMGSKPKRYRNKAILTACGRDDTVIERLEFPLKEFEESSVPMLSNARYRARRGIRYVSGELWGPGADFKTIERHYSDTGREFPAIAWEGAAPILLPVSLVPKWLGMLVRSTDDSDCPDVRLPEGDFTFAFEYDFDDPKTDYDRLCAQALEGGWVHRIRVGSGTGLTFSSVHEPWIWWGPQRILVGGGNLPTDAELDEIKWSNELTWEAKESRFVIMNSACYGGELSEQRPDEDYFKVQLPPGKYTVQFGKGGEYGPYLFRFVLKHGRPVTKTPKTRVKRESRAK